MRAANDINYIYKWVKGSKNFDCGAGIRYKDMNHKMLKIFGVINIPYDPIECPLHINQIALKMAMNKEFDTATSLSVLNILQNKNERFAHIQLIHLSLKLNGIAFFKIYEGDQSGNVIHTGMFYQNNLKIDFYLDEIKQFFKKTDIYPKKTLIIGYNS